MDHQTKLEILFALLVVLFLIDGWVARKIKQVARRRYRTSVKENEDV